MPRILKILDFIPTAGDIIFRRTAPKTETPPQEVVEVEVGEETLDILL